MRVFVVLAAAAGFLVSQPGVVRALTLAEIPYSSGGGGSSPIDPEIFLSFFVCVEQDIGGGVFVPCSLAPDPTISTFGVFDLFPVTVADVGSTFLVSVAGSADAAGAAALLTDGIDNSIETAFEDSEGGGGGIDGPESNVFSGNPFSTNGIDLAGNEITTFGLRLDEMTNDGFDISFAATFLIIPEPGTGLLLMMGLVGLAAARRRRRV